MERYRRAIDFYLGKAKGIRKSNQLFVSFIKKQISEKISKQSISRWTVQCISMASTRGKAAIAAFIRNEPLGTFVELQHGQLPIHSLPITVWMWILKQLHILEGLYFII